MAVNWQGGRWTEPSSVFPGGILATVAVSCAQPNACMAVKSKRDAPIY
jgi:hypothetical protein